MSEKDNDAVAEAAAYCEVRGVRGATGYIIIAFCDNWWDFHVSDGATYREVFGLIEMAKAHVMNASMENEDYVSEGEDMSS